MVSGYSGIGKSALVQELYKPITRRRGYFISGKFDQYQRDIPYSAVIKAFRGLVRQLLTESTAQLAEWRNHILTALGRNGQVIADVIPEVELIVGKQPLLPSLPPTEALNRFNLVFQNFIAVFAKPEHPLAIFLDDLQWADAASLKLMQLLMTASESHYLLLIGAYRDNEVSIAHPLMLTLEEICQSGAIVNQIYLEPLELPSITQLISETLKCSADEAKPLADLVKLKTGGNPFFINEFLKSLYTEKLLEFNFKRGGWQWDLVKIQASGFTDNVVELMANKIQQLTTEGQQVLQVAACIGNSLDLKTLGIVLEKSQRETAIQLWEAVSKGLILPLGDEYKWIGGVFTSDNTSSVNKNLDNLPDNLTVEYKFFHDRIQQAAYSLIPGDRQKEIHLKLGRLLLKTTPLEQLEERIFEIVNPLNISRELITLPEERYQLTQLNLIAGKKAKTATAYEAAVRYLTLGLELLPDKSWQFQYDLTLSLHVEAIEAAYLNTHFEQAETLGKVVLQQAKTPIEKVRVYETSILFSVSQNKMLSAIDTAGEILELLGVSLSQEPPTYQTVEELLELPEMTNPAQLAALRILMSVMAPAYIAKPSLLPLLIFTMVNLCVNSGNSPLAAYAYSVYSLLLCGKPETIDCGYRFGKLALKLLDQFDTRDVKAKVHQQFNAFVRPWKEPVRKTLKPFLETINVAIDSGDIEYACHCTVNYCTYSFFVGLPLDEVESRQNQHLELTNKYKQFFQFNYIKIWHQLVLALKSEEKIESIDAILEKDNILSELFQTNNQLSIFSLYFSDLFLSYLFKDSARSVASAALAEKYLPGVRGLLNSVLYNFYSSLALLSLCSQVSQTERKPYLQKVSRHQKMMSLWVSHAPYNFKHKYELVEAERARVRGKIVTAMECYDCAIQGARKWGYIQDEALAYELAAEFYLALGREEIAQNYMQKAYYSYSRWGATAKVKQLEETHSKFLFATSKGNSPSNLHRKSSTFSTTSSSESNSSAVLDLATVMKAAQAISSETILDKLLASLMKIMIENAGAQKGFLILETKGQLLIEAKGVVDSVQQGCAECNQVKVLQSIPVENSQFLSVAIVNYVARTRETVVLNDAVHEGRFTNDFYIKTNLPKSILCAPLIDRGKLSGIVYLENNLINGAFTPQRLELLNLLSAQAAISIENTRFYTNLAELNDAYERFVPRQFLEFLNKESIVDVQLGDQVQQDMSVLFSDIRSFTTLSESMTPEENFRFINSYLSRMEPAIAENNGFIDKYIGDAIMALFSGDADDAVKAGIAMLHRLTEYNQHRQNQRYAPIKIGIGINTGLLMLGTVGGRNRMNSTVISDAVNLAARMESLTKEYGVSLLISHYTFARLQNPMGYCIRLVDQVKVKGKSRSVAVFEVFDGDPRELREVKLATVSTFEEGLLLYYRDRFSEAAQRFVDCLRINPSDRVAQIYWERCQL
ncbi:AAA family ATPase [Coleofasciculus sp. LEGE 07092]|uniref:AAA family ATPase n=2 Tax=unclassified Coleofasciculus TaxID=2692782 RepID=UPI001D1542EF